MFNIIHSCKQYIKKILNVSYLFKKKKKPFQIMTVDMLTK